MLIRKILIPLSLFSLVIILCVWVYLITTNAVVLGYNINYQPTQPIPYSHELHAGKYKIDCRYCHTNVDQSRHATVPSVNICMNCHLSVKTDSPIIQKLSEAYSKGVPVIWQRVNLLPDYVKFDHSAHIRAKKDCRECHGDVETMHEVFQKESFSMGWCVDCHRQPENNAPVDCATCHY